MPQGPTDLLAWVTIGLFVAGVLAHRRDERVGRPRINKPDSQKDRKQKREGEYYYAPTG